ncbi:hypothetical protein FQN51_000001 [Onygenales sp. PD_10]|nr:hypothetical protein FQN51_000001 [Onygenales sp. PD_10]
MPPKLPPHTADALFFCPSCSTWRRSFTNTNTTNLLRRAHQRRRPASTLAASSHPSPASPTVNGARNVPERFRELYAALQGVRDVAANHVNMSRLQLALRGLEGEKGIVRVAVLGLDNTATTARLVRLLLADPLGEKAEWEDYLQTYRMESSRGLLIRYGEQTNLAVGNSLVPTISIPSRALKTGNLEILVSSLGARSISADQTIASDALLVPTIAIQSTSTGAHSFVRYPVHKSMVCGKGVNGLLAYTGLVGRVNPNTADSIRAAFELNVGEGATPEGNDGISFVDIERAETALDMFRESVQNATEYEKGWTGSGVQPLVDWISSPAKDVAIDPAIKRLVDSTLDGAEKSIVSEEKRKVLALEANTVPEEVRMALHETVSAWAERAHTELRDSLDQGFASKPWRTLAWWKLFWHVDDVGMITSRILRRKWLPEAEKEVIWMGGKIHQAGLLNQGTNSTNPIQNSTEFEISEEKSSTFSKNLWPTQIPDTRKQLTTSSVPSLHRLAQNLVMFSLSTTSLSSALSALVYVSTSTTSVYEAGTIATIGLFYSLRRQQKQWDAARGFWEREVREEGRQALKETENVLRSVIHEGGRGIETAPETEARQQIDRARQALSNVK